MRNARRLKADFWKVIDECSEICSVGMDPDDITKWSVILFGTEGSVWEGGTFHLTVEFVGNYPLQPPLVRFEPLISHPMLYPDGSICLNLLKPDWHPTIYLWQVLKEIHYLLAHPNLDWSMNFEAVRLFRESPEEYAARARACVEASWTFVS
jgi:ubiquitin-conjugating enzyme E2 A